MPERKARCELLIVLNLLNELSRAHPRSYRVRTCLPAASRLEHAVDECGDLAPARDRSILITLSAHLQRQKNWSIRWEAYQELIGRSAGAGIVCFCWQRAVRADHFPSGRAALRDRSAVVPALVCQGSAPWGRGAEYVVEQKKLVFKQFMRRLVWESISKRHHRSWKQNPCLHGETVVNMRSAWDVRGIGAHADILTRKSMLASEIWILHDAEPIYYLISRACD